MSRLDDDGVGERAASILRSLLIYQRADGDYAALVASLTQPDILRRIARCGSATKAAYAWLISLLEADLPPTARARRGKR